MPKKLTEMTGMPQMGAAFSGWESDITLTRITQTITAGLVADTETAFTFKGVVQPLAPEKLMLKPENLRSWKWLQVHCFTGANDLATNDQVVFDGQKFKIMAKLDYSLNNYVEYHLIENYE